MKEKYFYLKSYLKSIRFSILLSLLLSLLIIGTLIYKFSFNDLFTVFTSNEIKTSMPLLLISSSLLMLILRHSERYIMRFFCIYVLTQLASFCLVVIIGHIYL